MLTQTELNELCAKTRQANKKRDEEILLALPEAVVDVFRRSALSGGGKHIPTTVISEFLEGHYPRVFNANKKSILQDLASKGYNIDIEKDTFTIGE